MSEEDHLELPLIILKSTTDDKIVQLLANKKYQLTSKL